MNTGGKPWKSPSLDETLESPIDSASTRSRRLTRSTTSLRRAIAFEIKVSRHHETRGSSGDDRVELTLVGPGPLVRAEASGSDKYVAFDLAMGKLVERMRQAKDRKKVHRGQHRPVSLREAATDGFSVIDITPASADVIRAVSTGEIPVQSQSDRGEPNLGLARRHPREGVPGRAHDLSGCRGPHGTRRPRLLPLHRCGDRPPERGLPPQGLGLRRDLPRHRGG